MRHKAPPEIENPGFCRYPTPYPTGRPRNDQLSLGSWLVCQVREPVTGRELGWLDGLSLSAAGPIADTPRGPRGSGSILWFQRDDLGRSTRGAAFIARRPHEAPVADIPICEAHRAEG